MVTKLPIDDWRRAEPLKLNVLTKWLEKKVGKLTWCSTTEVETVKNRLINIFYPVFLFMVVDLK